MWVPCFFPQAHKLGMTGNGYVWLLVGWYNHQWWEAYDESNSECSVEETKEAVESSFYIATETTHLSTKQGPTIAHIVSKHALSVSLDRLSKNREEAGRGREWATLGVHPLSWLLSNNRLENVAFVSVPHISSNRLLPSNQDKGCTPNVAHSLALPLGPTLLNLWTDYKKMLYFTLCNIHV